MQRLVIALTLVCAFVLLAHAQKKYKPWLEWSDKDAAKMLNDSPWGQTQTETNTSEMFYNPGGNAPAGGNTTGSSGGLTGANDRSSQGQLNQAVNINFRIRLLSAKPIRQAFARQLMLQNPQMEAQLKNFAAQTSNEWIVVSVDYDGTDRRFTGRVMQALNSANLGVLANATYLERKDGKRTFLKNYQAPAKDGLGAKFIFARMDEDKPFLSEDSGYLRFYSEVGKEFKLNMRFKVSDLIYEGKLEF